MNTYGIAILGTGNVARAHLKAVQDTPGAELVALGARDADRGLAWAAEQSVTCPIYTRLKDLLANPGVDVIIITTPNHLHARQAIQAAQAGKHLLIEKPAALNLEELHELRGAVENSGVRTLVSFVLRWNPSLRLNKKLIGEGAIGNPFLIETCYWHATPRAVPGHWMTRKETAGSLFLMGGCHAVDTACWLAGAEVSEVMAYAAPPAKPWYEYPDSVIAAVRFTNGTVGRISASMGCWMPYTFEVTIMGDQGTIRDNRVYSHFFPGQTDYATIPVQLPSSGEVAAHPFTPGMQHLIECIDHQRETDISLDGSINVHEVCLAIDRSIETGQPVPLPLR